MSYDIYLEIETGGAEPATVGREFNMTSNVAPMWRHAGANLAEFDGKTAGAMGPLLDAAIVRMMVNPDTYRAMDPPNGWGDYEGCLEFLRELRDEFNRHPNATVRVCR